MQVQWERGRPLLSFDASHLLDEASRRKLRSGLPQRIVVAITAHEASGRKRLAATARSCRITFDLWSERWRLERSDPGTDRVWMLSSEREAIRRCLRFERRPMGSAPDFSRLRGRRIFFAVRAEFNPLSRATVQRLRRWLGRRSGASLQGEAFFGSVVGLFVDRRIADAERTLRFRSRAVRVP